MDVDGALEEWVEESWCKLLPDGDWKENEWAGEVVGEGNGEAEMDEIGDTVETRSE